MSLRIFRITHSTFHNIFIVVMITYPCSAFMAPVKIAPCFLPCLLQSFFCIYSRVGSCCIAIISSIAIKCIFKFFASSCHDVLSRKCHAHTYEHNKSLSLIITKILHYAYCAPSFCKLLLMFKSSKPKFIFCCFIFN